MYRSSLSGAPEPLEGALRLVGLQSAALVTNAETGDAVALLGDDGDPATFGAVPVGVLEEIRKRTLERGPVAAHEDRFGRDGLDCWVGVSGGLRKLVELDFLCRRFGRLLAGQDEQVVGEAGKPLGILLQLRDELLGKAVPPQIRDVAAQCGERRPQLVRGVREEAAFGFARPLEAGQHRVQRRPEPAHFVRRCGLRQTAPRVAGALDLRSGVGELSERAQGSAHQEGDCTRGQGRGDER